MMATEVSESERAIADRMAARTLELVDVSSVSGDEHAILDRIAAAVPSEAFSLADDRDGVLAYAPRVRRREARLVVLAGHVDTVPPHGNLPGREEGGAVIGRGAADMKGALAVILEVARIVADRRDASDVDVGLLFFGREELPITQSALLPLFERWPGAREIDLAVVMEPTGNAIQIGCLGNLNALVTVHGRAAHSARPWLGANAIHAAIEVLSGIAELPPRDVEVGGLTYREVVSVTTIGGGIATNVVPDLVEARVNFRYAPTRTPEEAEARLRELLGRQRAEVEVIANAPPGPVSVGNPLVARLRQAGGLVIEPKQAWTPVAEFATIGVDAVNFGPGDPEFAHRDDERVEISSLVRSFDVLRSFLAGTTTARED
jgi:succinyl-diaminopimelate desuccinylase